MTLVMQIAVSKPQNFILASRESMFVIRNIYKTKEFEQVGKHEVERGGGVVEGLKQIHLSFNVLLIR